MGAMEKLWSVIGFNTEAEEEEIQQVEVDETTSFFSPKERRFDKRGRNEKVVNIHETSQMKVAVEHPRDFEDARNIADHLKTGRAVTVNLEHLEHHISQRIIDFLSGTIYAINGNMQKIGTKIFLVTPSTVGIRTDEKDEYVKPSWK